ncbi:MAG TPA: hypothetical protein VMY05_05605 [Acidobacteriota bacterium]|nr:hypothetical protein [Acidobacteriota bacterium]
MSIRSEAAGCTRLRTLVLAVTLMLPAQLAASVFESGDDIHISNLHTIQDDFYAFGEQVRVDGKIEGDLTAFVYDCLLQGTVTRSANLFARSVDHSGHVGGSLRVLAQYVRIKGRVDGSLIAAGDNIRLSKGSVIERDVNLYGNDVSIDGVVNGNVRITGPRISIAGLIQGDVVLTGDRIVFSPPAFIEGNLVYTSSKQLTIDTTGVTIVGATTWKQPEKKEEETSLFTRITLKGSSLLAAFLFGVIVVRLFRPYAEEAVDQLRHRMTVSLAAGFLGLLVLGVCVVAFLASVGSAVIGYVLIHSDLVIPGSLLLIVSILLIPITSFATVSGGIILYSGAIVVAFLVGFVIKKLARPDSQLLNASSLFSGLIVLTLVFWLPYVGTLLYLLVTIAGTGAILLGIKYCRKAEVQTNQGTEASVQGAGPSQPGPVQ